MNPTHVYEVVDKEDSETLTVWLTREDAQQYIDDNYDGDYLTPDLVCIRERKIGAA